MMSISNHLKINFDYFPIAEAIIYLQGNMRAKKMVDPPGLEPRTRRFSYIWTVRKVSGRTFNIYRHTFVSFCANAGVPLDIVAAIAGHGSSAMTRHYAHISAEAKHRAIEALPMLQQEEEKQQTTADKREQLYDRLSLLSEDRISGILGMLDQMPDSTKRIVS